jgi:tetratricopeptide (TPR) repeat protein
MSKYERGDHILLKKNIFLLLLIGTINMALGEELSIVSNPEKAIIFVKNNTTKKMVKIGMTPLKISMNEVANNYANGDVFVLELKKNGFDPYRVLLARSGSNDVELNVNLEVNKDIQLVKDVDTLIAKLFEVQRRIRVKDYPGAIKMLTEAEKKFPHFSIIYELKASAYYLDKKFTQALNFYRKAFSVNPENRDAYVMKLYLEKKFKLEGA